MQILSIVLGVLIGLFIGPIILLIIGIILDKRFYKIHMDGRHHCNECEESFIANYREITYKYCPDCGKKLDYFKEKEKDGGN